MATGLSQLITTTLVLAQPGPQGPPGTGGGDGAKAYPASGAISGHRAVRMLADESVAYADSATQSHALGVIGITMNAAANGADVTVVSSGPVSEPTWAWTPDLPVLLGLNGALTQTLPPSALFSLVVGVALTPTKLLVGIQPPLFLS